MRWPRPCRSLVLSNDPRFRAASPAGHAWRAAGQIVSEILRWDGEVASGGLGCQSVTLRGHGANLVFDPTSLVPFSSARLRSLPFFPRPKGLDLILYLAHPSNPPAACCLLAAPALPDQGAAQPGGPPSSALPPGPWGTPVCLSQSISKHCCARLQMCGPQLGPAR